MISVVIVNWNSGELLGKCIHSLRKHARGCRIVVVDNASTDSSLADIETACTDIDIILNDSNRGFAAACNQGWQSSRCEHVLFLNPDTECYPGSVDCLEKTLSGNEGIQAVGGCLVSPDGSLQTDFNVRSFPTIGRVAAEMFFVDELRRALGFSRRSGRMHGEDAFEVDQPAAACLMATRTALESIGGFDESFYPAWFEDVDLCFRLHEAGGRIRYQPRARFLHHGGYSLDRMSGQEFLKHFHKNQIRYFRKHRGRLAALQVQKIIILGLLLRTMISFLYPLVRDTSRSGSARIFWNALLSIARAEEAWV